jgi:hypothetical protein
MIPDDLKPGALVRCLNPTARLRLGQVYVVTGYNRNCDYTGESASVLLEGVRTSHTQGDQGWMRFRFKLVSDADGADYQGPDDVDLPGRRHPGLTATEQREQEQEAERLYANMTVRIERT